MGVIVRCLAAAAVLAVSSRALADPDAGPPSSPADIAARVCAKGPDHATAVMLQDNATRFMKVAVSVPLSTKQSLVTLKTIPESVRADVTMLKCEEPALSPKELADVTALEVRASKWADDEDKVLATEETTRTNVVVPLCEAIWGRDSAQASIDHERANPSGVVDLRALHDAGETLQYYRQQIAALTPLYVAARHHTFTTWQAEGACVADAKPDGS